MEDSVKNLEQYPMSADIIIVGTGAAGLFHALNLPEDKKIIMLTKSKVEESDSYLAQGGICVLKDESDYESFYQDTLRAGHYENDTDSVETMIRTSPEIIKDLITYGVEFEKKNGEYAYTREGAHSTERILYHEDLTGKEITSKLLEEVRLRKNIMILENTSMIDIITQKVAKDQDKPNIYKTISHGEHCNSASYNKANKSRFINETKILIDTVVGVIIRNQYNKIAFLKAPYVTLATGGLGGLYDSSTNFSHLTGDSIAIAIKHGIKLQNVNYIQFHPTSLYIKKPGRRFLISESVRGEGAYLYNKNMERFVDELLPRDILSNKIKEQMRKDNMKYVWLSVQHLDPNVIIKRFPNIYKRCLEEGYDITKECIPVTPAQHYYMGGIKVDLDSKTSMDHLYAIGETSCNGVHGANRLASNSLLESLVFAKRAAKHIENNYSVHEIDELELDVSVYSNKKKIEQEYKELVLHEIERANRYERYHNKEA
ncbi:FAD-binding protein [Anaeromicropila herbilytica]|uniref:L-aspartate oxidase n=1 Tax=Anaeromicropila herbilytica TaxID=2785025 RepID=A0A7R7ICG3_9FIRM|nr:FAD-binding protein [Anaeromicropila herbilytica]BCN30577.1 L-aspartate oxidase [Anaeromicropila herbilytica]